MAKLTAAQAADKHKRRLQGATEDIASGIARVSVAPGQQAAAKQQKMLSRLQEKVNDGTWAKRVASVSLEDWKKAATEKGVGRISQGIESAQGKMIDFYGKLLPYIESGQATVNKMPDLTIEDSINRATAWMRHMSKFKR